MKKLAYLIGAFVIYYFIYIAIKGAITLAELVSFGQMEIKYGFYGLLTLVLFIFGVLPIVKYLSIPQLKSVHGLMQKKKIPRSILTHFLKSSSQEERKIFAEMSQEDIEAQKKFIMTCLKADLSRFDSIIGKYAKKTTVSVMISPNSFIDGLIILLSNINMITELGKTVRLRIGLKDTFVLLFKIISFSAVAGLVEEFDELIEDMVEEVIEEFGELLQNDGVQEGLNGLVSGIPFISILPKLISPLLQGAANFSFVYYIGLTYKNYISETLISVEPVDEEAIKHAARKEARQMKRMFLKNALKQIPNHGFSQTGKMMNKLAGLFKRKMSETL